MVNGSWGAGKGTLADTRVALAPQMGKGSEVSSAISVRGPGGWALNPGPQDLRGTVGENWGLEACWEGAQNSKGCTLFPGDGLQCLSPGRPPPTSQ